MLLPACASSRTSAGPSAVKSCLPIFSQPATPVIAVAMRRASLPVGKSSATMSRSCGLSDAKSRADSMTSVLFMQPTYEKSYAAHAESMGVNHAGLAWLMRVEPNTLHLHQAASGCGFAEELKIRISRGCTRVNCDRRDHLGRVRRSGARNSCHHVQSSCLVPQRGGSNRGAILSTVQFSVPGSNRVKRSGSGPGGFGLLGERSKRRRI